MLGQPKDLAGKLAAAAERDNAGMTCLHLATMGNRDSVVSWLASTFGRDLCLVKSMDGVLAIHLATASGKGGLPASGHGARAPVLPSVWSPLPLHTENPTVIHPVKSALKTM